MAKSKYEFKRGDRVSYRDNNTPGTVRRVAHGEFFVTWDDEEGQAYNNDSYSAEELEPISE